MSTNYSSCGSTNCMNLSSTGVLSSQVSVLSYDEQYPAGTLVREQVLSSLYGITLCLSLTMALVFYKRRALFPLKPRLPPFVAAGNVVEVLSLVVGCTVYATNLPCWYHGFLYLVSVPLVLFIVLLRGLHLLFQFHHTEDLSKLEQLRHGGHGAAAAAHPPGSSAAATATGAAGPLLSPTGRSPLRASITPMDGHGTTSNGGTVMMPSLKLGGNGNSVGVGGSPVFGSIPTSSPHHQPINGGHGGASLGIDRTPTHGPAVISIGGSGIGGISGTGSTKSSRGRTAYGTTTGTNGQTIVYEMSWWTRHAHWFRPKIMARVLMTLTLVLLCGSWLPVAVLLGQIDGGDMTCNDSRTWPLYEVLYTISMVLVFLTTVGLSSAGLALRRFDNDNFAMRLEFLFVCSACSGGLLIDVGLYTLVKDERLQHLLFDCVILSGLWIVLSGTTVWPLALSFRAQRRQKQVAAQLVSAARLDQMLAVPEGWAAFYKYASLEFNLDSLIFWRLVQQYKQLAPVPGRQPVPSTAQRAAAAAAAPQFALGSTATTASSATIDAHTLGIAAVMLNEADQIYDDYIMVGGATEINIAASTRAQILAALLRLHEHFDPLIAAAAAAAATTQQPQSNKEPNHNQRGSVSSYVEQPVVNGANGSPLLSPGRGATPPLIGNAAALRINVGNSPSPHLPPLPGQVSSVPALPAAPSSSLASGSSMPGPGSPLVRAPPRFASPTATTPTGGSGNSHAPTTALGLMISAAPPILPPPQAASGSTTASTAAQAVDHLASLRSLFDEAQQICYQLMETNTFARFRCSKIFRSLIESSCAPGILALTTSDAAADPLPIVSALGPTSNTSQHQNQNQPLQSHALVSPTGHGHSIKVATTMPSSAVPQASPSAAATAITSTSGTTTTTTATTTAGTLVTLSIPNAGGGNSPVTSLPSSRKVAFGDHHDTKWH